MKQRSFASLSFESKKKPTRRERFLGEMDKVVPWKALLTLIEPSYPTAGRRGRPPMPASTMLRIHFMQQWYALSDPAMEDALYEIASMRRFAGLELNEDAIPDETTILKFRRFLEQHGLAVKILDAVNAHLGQQGLLLRQGTIVDATIIQAPSSTKNRDKQRDPAMRQTKIRSKVEHPFRVIKRQFGCQKLRFKGLIKSTAQVLTLFALSNLWMVRRTWLSSAGEVRL